MPTRAPTFLSFAQRAALAAHRASMVDLCTLAGRPDQAAEFTTRGLTLSAAHAALVEAAAEGLPASWPLAQEALAGRARHHQDEDGAADSEQPAVTDADLGAALAYAAEVGGLCALAGFPERAIDALDRGVSIRVLRTELLAARSEQVPVMSIDTTLDPTSGQREADGFHGLAFHNQVYARRAAAMGQGIRDSGGLDRQPPPDQQRVSATTAAARG